MELYGKVKAVVTFFASTSRGWGGNHSTRKTRDVRMGLWVVDPIKL